MLDTLGGVRKGEVEEEEEWDREDEHEEERKEKRTIKKKKENKNGGRGMGITYSCFIFTDALFITIEDHTRRKKLVKNSIYFCLSSNLDHAQGSISGVF